MEIKTTMYLLCFAAGLLGIIFHTLMKMQAVKKRCEAAGIGFSGWSYLSSEWLALASSIVAVCIGLFVLDEAVNLKPQVLAIIKYLFVFVGYSGSSLLLSVLGKTDKTVNKLINKEPDITGKNNEPLRLDGNGAVIPDKGP